MNDKSLKLLAILEWVQNSNEKQAETSMSRCYNLHYKFDSAKASRAIILKWTVNDFSAST